MSGDHYYALARTAHQLYRIDFNGGVELYAGTGADGQDDGPVAEATFSRPNGIGVHRPTGEIYITGSSDQDLNQIPIRRIAAADDTNDNDFIINPGLAGSWVDPAVDGQGVVLDFAVSDERFDAVLFWFTYDDQAPDVDSELGGFGSRQSRWFTASGAVDGASVVMPIFRSSGGVFDDPRPVSTAAVGSMELEFFSCFEAVLSYQFTVPEEKIGSLSLQRITPDIWCETLDSP